MLLKFLLFSPELWAIVNNAGILKGFDVELTDLDEFREVMEVNAFGPVRVTKAFLPLLRQSRGRVVNLTSLGGKLSHHKMSFYKLCMFTKLLKRTLMFSLFGL